MSIFNDTHKFTQAPGVAENIKTARKKYADAIAVRENPKDNPEQDFRDVYGEGVHKYFTQTAPKEFKDKYIATYGKGEIQGGEQISSTSVLPSSDRRSDSYTGNPNLAFTTPNTTLTGQERAGQEQTMMSAIEAVVPVPFLEFMNPVAKAGQTLNKIINKTDDLKAVYYHHPRRNPNMKTKQVGDVRTPFNAKTGHFTFVK